MARVKTLMTTLMSSALFWIFVILMSMVVFILKFERPLTFVVDQQYNLF